MTVIDIRGTHGSGKTYTVRKLIKLGESRILKQDGKIVGYHLKHLNCGVVGPYKEGVASGGCDCISPVSRIVDLIRWFGERYPYVVLEGILVAHTFKRYHELAQEMGDYRFLFLNTPLPKCLGRVLQRRRATGNTKPFKTHNVRSDYRQIWVSTRRKLVEAGHYVRVVDWKDPVADVLEELSR